MDGGDDGDSDDSSLIDSILNIPHRIAERLKVHFDTLASGVTGITDKLSSFFSSWSAIIDTFRSNVGSWFTNLGSNVSAFKDSVGSWFVNLGSSIGEGLTSVKDKITGALGEQLSNIVQGFENVKNNFVNLLGKLAELWLEINTLPLRIQEKVKELFEYFFLPDEDLTNQRLDQIRQKFAFIDMLAGNGEAVINFLQNASGNKAPVITISLGSYKGSFNYGSGSVVMDFSWYEPYKPMVDNIVAGIIWAVWLWHMYKRIPDIIAGNSMTTASVLRAARKDG